MVPSWMPSWLPSPTPCTKPHSRRLFPREYRSCMNLPCRILAVTFLSWSADYWPRSCGRGIQGYRYLGHGQRCDISAGAPKGTIVSLVMFVTLLVSVTAAGLLTSYFLGEKQKRKSLSANSTSDMKQRVLTNRYFRNIRKGDFARPLARVYSQMDMAVIESILAARNIASQRLFSITNNMRTGIGIRGYNDILIVVLNTEYCQAREIMLDYLRGRRSVSTHVRTITRLRNVAEALLFGWAANADYRLPELLRLGEFQSKYVVRSNSLRHYRRTRRQSPSQRPGRARIVHARLVRRDN